MYKRSININNFHSPVKNGAHSGEQDEKRPKLGLSGEWKL